MSDSSTSRVPGWLWLIAGTALGALVMFLMRLSELDPALTLNNLRDSEERIGDNSQPLVDTQKPAERRFDFYNLLRDTEVPVTATPADPTAQAVQMDYLLQVASFQSATDANEVRAELVLLNLSAWVEKSQNQSGTTWHRVIVGPFSHRSQMAKAKGILLSNRYEAMMLKRPKTIGN